MGGNGREFVFVLSATADDVEAASKKAADSLRKVSDTTTAQDHAQGKATQSSETLLASLTKAGAGAFGLKKVTDIAMASAEALVQAQINADRLNMQLSAAAGASKAGQELDYVRQVSNSLETAQALVAAPAYVNLFEGDAAKYAKNEEAAMRRRDALGKVTAELTSQNSKLVASLKVLSESYQAGDIADRKEYDRLVGLAYAQNYRAPKAVATKQEPPVDHLILDKFDAQARLRQAAYEADTKVREFMLGKVQASDERQQALRDRQLEAAGKFSERMREETDKTWADLIPDAEGRARALLAIDRARLTSQVDLLNLEGEERKKAQDDIAAYMVAREAQLTEDLKPEWQKRLEAWQDSARLMNETHATIMQGIVDEGERAWVEWGRTGKLNVKGLVNFVGDELAKLAYRQAIAPALSQGANWLLNMIGIAGSSVGGASASAGSQYALPTTGIKFGPPNGMATGTNRLEHDTFTLVHKDEAVIPKKFNPWANGVGIGGFGGPNVTQHITYHVPPGMTPAAFASALEANNRRIKGEVISDMLRPGRALNRVAALSRL